MNRFRRKSRARSTSNTGSDSDTSDVVMDSPLLGTPTLGEMRRRSRGGSSVASSSASDLRPLWMIERPTSSAEDLSVNGTIDEGDEEGETQYGAEIPKCLACETPDGSGEHHASCPKHACPSCHAADRARRTLSRGPATLGLVLAIGGGMGELQVAEPPADGSLAEREGVLVGQSVRLVAGVAVRTLEDVAQQMQRCVAGTRIRVGLAQTRHGTGPTRATIRLGLAGSSAAEVEELVSLAEMRGGRWSIEHIPGCTKNPCASCRFVDMLEAQAKASRVSLGINVAADGRKGRLLVATVDADSPAAKAGVSVGQRVVSVLGRPMADMDAWARVLELAVRPGDDVELVVAAKRGKGEEKHVRFQASAADMSAEDLALLLDIRAGRSADGVPPHRSRCPKRPSRAAGGGLRHHRRPSAVFGAETIGGVDDQLASGGSSTTLLVPGQANPAGRHGRRPSVTTDLAEVLAAPTISESPSSRACALCREGMAAETRLGSAPPSIGVHFAY